MRALTSKMILIAILCVCFLFGLFFIGSIVTERQRYYQQSINEIARDNFYPQTIISPFIVVPVHYSLCTDEEKSKKPAKDCNATRYATIFSDESHWNNQLTVATRFRKGIYQATDYINTINITGQFKPTTDLLNPTAGQVVDWQKAAIHLPVSDLRGLAQQPIITLQDKKYQFTMLQTEQNLRALPSSYTSLVIGERAKNAMDFNIDLSLSGLQSFRIVPLGQRIQAKLTANWAHPNFSGGISPQQRSITRQATTADWDNSYAPMTNSRLMSICINSMQAADCEKLQIDARSNNEYSRADTSLPTADQLQSFNIQFIQPINIYTLTDRTLKYALLFLIIIFGTFFLFEVLKNLQVHPIQYALVGAAQAVFYLLLLSFSEQFSFGYAYLGSSIACIVLISWYVSYVLNGIKRALGLAVVMSAMYATLYILLRSQQHTLMLGSVLVFMLIAVVMFLTRHINWYRVSDDSKKQQPITDHPSIHNQSL